MLDATGPGANRGVSAAVRMQDRQGVGRARLAPDGDEHAAARRQRFENPPIMRLKPDAAHGAGQPELRQMLAGP